MKIKTCHKIGVLSNFYNQTIPELCILLTTPSGDPLTPPYRARPEPLLRKGLADEVCRAAIRGGEGSAGWASTSGVFTASLKV